MDNTDSTGNSDRIERSIVIQVPRRRVWRALTTPDEFGRWFGANLEGQVFEAGQGARGPLVYPGYEHIVFDVIVERIEVMELFSYRWHPYAVDPSTDYAAEQPTLVTFTLADAPRNSTLLTVVESGFDLVPLHRRLEAFRMSSRGWEYQLDNLMQHVVARP